MGETALNDAALKFAEHVKALFSDKQLFKIYPVTSKICILQFHEGDKIIVFDYNTTMESARRVLVEMSKEPKGVIYQ